MVKKATLATRRVARTRAKTVAKRSKLGSGARFKAVAAAAKASGARNPNAVAAAVGRRKYGKKKMTSLSKAVRRSGRRTVAKKVQGEDYAW